MPLKREMIDISDPRVTLIGHPAPPWLVNYADLMTELVCFFVILYAMAAALNKNIVEAKKEVEQKLKQEQVKVEVNKDGMKITLEEQKDKVFFQSGSPELSPHMKTIIATIGPILNKLAGEGHDIIVEGHTDDIPIRNPQYPSNWELSTARATNVVQYMVHNAGLPPTRMGAIGYGQFHPLVANDTDEHRAQNRRVVFFVKNTKENFKKGDEDKKGHKDKAPPAEEQPAEGTEAPAEASAAADDNVSNPVPQPDSQPVAE